MNIDGVDFMDVDEEFITDGPEYDDYIAAREDYEKAVGVMDVLDGVDALDPDLIVDIETQFPGVVTDSIPANLWSSSESIDITKSNVTAKMNESAALSARATLVVISKFGDFIHALSNSRVDEGIGAVLNTIQTTVSKVTLSDDEHKKTVRSVAYKALMGVPPESDEQVVKLFETLSTYKHPIQMLKDFPNNKYDKIFTPLLASTVSEASPIFHCFSELNKKYATVLIDNVHTTISDLEDIIASKDYARMARYNRNIIPSEITKIMTDVVASLNIEIDHKVPLLKQDKLISKAIAKMLRVDEDSLKKKATVVNTIAYRSQELDNAYSDIVEATDKLASFDSNKKGKDLIAKLKEFRYTKPIKAVVKDSISGIHKQANDTHRRVLSELDDLWSLINILTRMSISYVTMYATLSKTLEIFHRNYVTFAKQIGTISDTPVIQFNGNRNATKAEDKEEDTDDDDDELI